MDNKKDQPLTVLQKIDNKMEFDLTGKTALVTGSSRGIGNEIASVLLNEGCYVVLNGLHKSTLRTTAKLFGKNCSFFSADVTKINECKKLVNYIVKERGSLDILICNVGDGRSAPPGTETLQDWHKMININLFSAINIIKAAENQLMKSKGVIICISSIAGMRVTGAPITYSTTKAALNTFVKNLSKPLAKKGIRINVVAPGNIIFKGSVWEKKLKENPYTVKKMLVEEVSLGRFGTSTEVANLVIFLVSSYASFITGSIFVIDGGQIR